jgi:fatty acid desaturase
MLLCMAESSPCIERPPIENASAVALREALKSIRQELAAAPEVEAFLRNGRKRRNCAVDFLFVLTAFGLGVYLVAVYALAMPVLAVAGTVSIVAALSAVSALSHESWHGHLSNSPGVNDALSEWLLSPLLVADYHVQRREHLFHHSYLGDDKDPDGMLYRMNGREFTVMILRRFLIVPYLLKLMGLGKEAASTQRAHAMISSKAAWLRIAMVHAMWVGTLLLAAVLVSPSVVQLSAALFLGYLLPLLVSSTMIALRGHREHAHDFATGYTITFNTHCNVAERWLISGGYFNLHACHHLFPELPQHRLPAFSRLLYAQGIARHLSSPQSVISARSSYFSTPA